MTAETSLSPSSSTNHAKSSSFQRIFAIARNAFREAVRDRILYNLVIFVLLLTGCAIFLGELSGGEELKIIVDMGLTSMLVFGAFIAIFVGVGLVYKEIEKRTVYAIFAKPVGRGEFLVGKYLGLCLTLLVNTAIMGVGVSLALLYVKKGWTPLAISIWPSIFLIFCELIVLTAVALLFSTFSSPALSALLTLAILIIGNFLSDIRVFAQTMNSTVAKAVLTVLYYVLPNLAPFNFITPAGHGGKPPAAVIGGGLLYAVVYSAVLLAAATLVFNRRNFK